MTDDQVTFIQTGIMSCVRTFKTIWTISQNKFPIQGAKNHLQTNVTNQGVYITAILFVDFFLEKKAEKCHVTLVMSLAMCILKM